MRIRLTLAPLLLAAIILVVPAGRSHAADAVPAPSISGMVVLYNTYAPTPVRLIRNTRLQAPSGAIFRLREDVSVPGYTTYGTRVSAGLVAARVYADDSGASNLIGPSFFSIPGYVGMPQETKVFARSFTAMTYDSTAPATNSMRATTTATTTMTQPSQLTLTAAPASLTQGSNVALAWNAPADARCAVSGDTLGVRAAADSLTVTPSITTTYHVTCVSSAGVMSAATTVIVSQASTVALAQCLAAQRATLYGAFWCPHCQHQKQLFGDGAASLPYVECSTADGTAQTQACIDAKITGYPTWVFADGSRLVGEEPLSTLATKVSCPAYAN